MAALRIHLGTIRVDFNFFIGATFAIHDVRADRNGISADALRQLKQLQK